MGWGSVTSGGPGSYRGGSPNAFSVSLAGDAGIERMLAELPLAAVNRAAKPLVIRGSRMLAAAIKAEAPAESGLLKAAIGVSPLRDYGGKTLFAAAGIRRGFRRTVYRTARKKLRFRGKARSGDDPAELWRNPVKYLHLVTGGRKAVTVIHKKQLYDAYTGRFFGKSVAAAQPNPFVDRAFAAAAPAVASMIEREGASQIVAEAERLARGK